MIIATSRKSPAPRRPATATSGKSLAPGRPATATSGKSPAPGRPERATSGKLRPERRRGQRDVAAREKLRHERARGRKLRPARGHGKTSAMTGTPAASPSPGTRRAPRRPGRRPRRASAGCRSRSGSSLEQVDRLAARASRDHVARRAAATAAAGASGGPTGPRRARRPRGAAPGRARPAGIRPVWTPPRPAAPGPAAPGGGLGDQQAQTRRAAPADPAAQLVQLGDAEPVGVEHDHHGGVGHVDADLDHRGRDQHVELAGGEVAHHGVLLVGRQPAVQHADPQPVQRPLGRQRAPRRAPRSAAGARGPSSPVRLDVVLRRTRVAADARADHVRLVALLDLLAQPLPGPVQVAPASRPPAPRGRRSASGRAAARPGWTISRSPKTVIATVRGIGVAVITSTCGGCVGLGPQRVALLDAEPVLLVDHDQARGRRSRRPRRAARGCRRRCRPRPEATSASACRRAAAALRAGDQRDPGGLVGAVQLAGPAQRAEQVADAAVVLGGEHLGRGEQRGLAAGVDHLQHRRAARRASCPSRPRPAAAGASGAPSPGRAAISSPTATLAVGQRVRQRARRTRPAARRSRGGRGTAGAGRGPQLALHQGQLHRERLVPLQPLAAPRPAISSDGRAVDLAQRGAAGRSARARPAAAAGIGSGGGWSMSSTTRDASGDLPRSAASSVGRVDRDQRAGELLDLVGRPRSAVVEHHVLGVGELALALELADLAGEHAPHRPRPQLALAASAWLAKKVSVSSPPEPSPTSTSSRLPRPLPHRPRRSVAAPGPATVTSSPTTRLAMSVCSPRSS